MLYVVGNSHDAAGSPELTRRRVLQTFESNGSDARHSGVVEFYMILIN